MEPMQIDTGPEDSDANRVMVENTTLVNMKTVNRFCYLWRDFSLLDSVSCNVLITSVMRKFFLKNRQ